MADIVLTKKNGFTLIELLVVVLIIGILAAIALPQYERSVERSRMTEAVTNVKILAEAQRRYLLATGQYAYSINQLDISIPGTEGGNNYLYTKDFIYGVNDSRYLSWSNRAPLNNRYYLYIEKNNTVMGCHAWENITSVQQALCTQLNNTGTL